MPDYPPPDPRLLELLPRLSNAAVYNARRRRLPLDESEVRSIVAYILFRFFRRRPEGTADELEEAAYYRVRYAMHDEVRTKLGRRRVVGPSGLKLGFDFAEVAAAQLTGELPARAWGMRYWQGFSADEYSGDLIDPTPPADELLHERRTTERVASMLGILTKQERRAIELHLLEGIPQHVAATMMGVSAPRISQLIAAAVDKLRRHQGFERRPKKNRHRRAKA